MGLVEEDVPAAGDALVTPPAIVVEEPSSNAAIEDAKEKVTPPGKGSSVKLDDFICLGRYTIVVCLLSELMILAQLGNMLYMMYAGAVGSRLAINSSITHK